MAGTPGRKAARATSEFLRYSAIRTKMLLSAGVYVILAVLTFFE